MANNMAKPRDYHDIEIALEKLMSKDCMIKHELGKVSDKRLMLYAVEIAKGKKIKNLLCFCLQARTAVSLQLFMLC